MYQDSFVKYIDIVSDVNKNMYDFLINHVYYLYINKMCNRFI